MHEVRLKGAGNYLPTLVNLRQGDIKFYMHYVYFYIHILHLCCGIYV
jgi:hypothetical protein